MQAIDNRNVYEPLVLTPRQQQVLEALKDKETEEYALSKWYLGALYTLDNPYNPDRISQAAQSLRELLEKLLLVLQESDVQGGGSVFKGMRNNIEKHISVYKERYPGNWKGQKINKRLAKGLTMLEKYLELNRHLS